MRIKLDGVAAEIEGTPNEVADLLKLREGSSEAAEIPYDVPKALVEAAYIHFLQGAEEPGSVAALREAIMMTIKGINEGESGDDSDTAESVLAVEPRFAREIAERDPIAQFAKDRGTRATGITKAAKPRGGPRVPNDGIPSKTKISDFIKAHPYSTMAEIKAALEMNPNTISARLTQLKDTGFIVRRKRQGTELFEYAMATAAEA